MEQSQWFLARILPVLAASMAGCAVRSASGAEVGRPYELSVSLDPLADTGRLSFSWKTRVEDAYDWRQGAWQIQLAPGTARLGDGDDGAWDSGRQESGQQLFVPYTGPGLSAATEYRWRVRVWDRQGIPSAWSLPAVFCAPMDTTASWPAEWITYQYSRETASPLFRTSFQVDLGRGGVRSARLFICGLGYYEAWLNGEKLGDRVLDPAQTNYDDYAFYSVLPVSPDALGERNTLGVMLGDGWFNQYRVWGPAMAYGPPVLSCFLQIDYTDGSRERVSSDLSWTWREGPVVRANVYAGEVYDARLEVDDWCLPGASVEHWKPVVTAPVFPPRLVEQTMEPIRRTRELPARAFTRRDEGTCVFDFGQNFAGWVRLRVRGTPGQTLTLRFAEDVDASGAIDVRSTGPGATGVVQTDVYTCRGDRGEEIWEPRFTYHGFRYVEVSGLEGEPTLDMLTGIAVHNDLEVAGEFGCSSEQVNRLQDLARWTLRGNLHGVLSDCPHRERCGWTGDAHAAAPALVMNYNARLFLTKYLHDLRSSGREEKRELYFGRSFGDRSHLLKPSGVPTMIVPGRRTSGMATADWGTVVTQAPWMLYQYYGDIDSLREFYPDMRQWVEYIAGIAVGETSLPEYPWTTTVTGPIRIESAVFGVLDEDPPRARDVTDEVRARVTDVGDGFPVRQLLAGGDPAPGVIKTLVVEYVRDGERLTAQAREGESIGFLRVPEVEPTTDSSLRRGSDPERLFVLHGLGDWCPPGSNANIDAPVAFSSTAFHFLDLSILTRAARVLGHEADAARYGERMGLLRERFNQRFYNPEAADYGSQTANSMALQMGLAPESDRERIAATLARQVDLDHNGFLRTGIFGIGRILPALAENGQEQTAFGILTKTGNPSFARMWEHFDATTLWEVLPVDDWYEPVRHPVSRNHPMQAGYGEWFIRGIAGIDFLPGEPGYRHFVLAPWFTSLLDAAEAVYESPYGTILSRWQRTNARFTWEFEIPANTRADVHVPRLRDGQTVVLEGSAPVPGPEPGETVISGLGSGRYRLGIDL